MSEYVPDEVVVDILLRLPVKSLIRFRCVSKSWNSLITSPAFVHSHLNQSNPSNNNLPHPLLIVRHCSSSADRSLDEEHYKLFYDNEAFEECAEFDFPTKSRSLKHFRLIASENGLICLSEQERYVLWNPSIRKCWNLPKPCITARKHSGSTCHEAFGFDPRTNDYKVVRIVIHHSTKEAPVEEALVEVYSVSTCSWRLSSASLTPSTNFTDWRKPKACLKGSVHFAALGQRNGTGIGFVLSFDLRDEVFREMIFPHNMTRSHTDIVTRIFSGSLALLCYDEKRFSCSIWVMKEYGVVDSWVKQFTIDIAGGIEKNVLGFRKNGHIILEIRKEVYYWELFSYDPESQQATKLEIQKNMHTFCVDTYRENLVLLNQANVVSRSRVTKKRKNSEVVGGGVIPTQSSSSHVRHATQYGNHDECRIKQQENEKRLEELLSRISKLESSYATMQSSYATMQSSYATMQSSYATMQSSHATMQALHATMQAQLDSILLHIRGHGESSSRGESNESNI